MRRGIYGSECGGEGILKQTSGGPPEVGPERGAPVGAVLLHAALIIGAIIMAAPFVWMVLSSLKPFSQVFLIPPKWIPDPWEWGITSGRGNRRRSAGRISTAFTLRLSL
ncbi:hypothetical protein LJK88_23735 [Paenibacillus sp. P26]|nr:hypothetical protein LJK88_23735 [Paenibacillus sp. P26]